MKIYKYFILFVGTCILICVLKISDFCRNVFDKHVMSNNFNFAVINSYYKSMFGVTIPFFEYAPVIPVFSENLIYVNSSGYMDGVELEVGFNYLVPVLYSGIVTFIGEKEGYGNVVIIECENGLTIWYGGINIVNLKMYDYVLSGYSVGEVSSYLYLVFYKEGKILSYEEYI